MKKTDADADALVVRLGEGVRADLKAYLQTLTDSPAITEHELRKELGWSVMRFNHMFTLARREGLVTPTKRKADGQDRNA